MKAGIYRQKLEFEGNFTTIPNKWIRNTGLSVSANFLLIYLLTHEVGYNITFGQIEKEICLGETAIRTAMNQLKEAGWLETYRTVDDKGYNAGLAWILKEPDGLLVENPNLGIPALDNPGLDLRGALENNLIKKTTFKEYMSDFEEFWLAYPRKVAKKVASRAWEALSVADRVKALEGAVRLSNDPNLPEERYVPHPASWLRGERWNDGALPERAFTADELRAKELEKAARRREQELARSQAFIAEQEEIARRVADEPAVKCVHGRVLAACMPCIKSGKVG